MSNRLIIGIIIVSVFLGAATLTRGHDWGDDFASYIMQAGSILNNSTRDFVERNSFTIFESSNQIGPVAYPWGYPVILTPVYAIKGIHPLALKLPGLLFYAGFLICLYLLMKKRLTQTESLVLVSLFAFNPLLLQFLDQILSDVPFLFFTTLSLLLMTRAGKRNLLHYIGIGAALFFTPFMRVTGILLLGCSLIVEFFRLLANRSDRGAALEIVKGSAIVCFVYLVLWITNLLLFPSGGESYFSQYADLIETARAATPAYFNVFSYFFGDTQAWKYLYYLVFIFFLLGAWNQWRQEPIFLLFFVLWIVVHITYPYFQGPRYIFSLLPIFIYFAFQGMKFLIARLPENHHPIGQAAVYGFWILIAGVFLV